MAVAAGSLHEGMARDKRLEARSVGDDRFGKLKEDQVCSVGAMEPTTVTTPRMNGCSSQW